MKAKARPRSAAGQRRRNSQAPMEIQHRASGMPEQGRRNV
jgi:hypothetical protein